MKIRLFLLFLLPALAHGSESLCEADEQILFACSVGKAAKLVSLCGSQKLNQSAGYVRYRFGSHENIEFTFPSSKVGSLSKFKYSHYFRYQFDQTSVSFSNGGFEYHVFTSYDGEEKEKHPLQEYGVLVSNTKRPGKQTRIICSSPATVNLVRLENVLARHEEE